MAKEQSISGAAAPYGNLSGLLCELGDLMKAVSSIAVQDSAISAQWPGNGRMCLPRSWPKPRKVLRLPAWSCVVVPFHIGD